MIDRSEAGKGTVKTIRNRAGAVVGYQALLPRELSRAPKGTKHPELYQEPFGERCETHDAARALLDGALPTLRANPLMGRGPSVLDYVRQEIQAKLHDARRQYDSAARANKAVSTWRSIDKRWLAHAPFAQRSPQGVTHAEVQRWFDWLKDEAESDRGEPLSGSFIRNVAVLLRSGLDRVVGLEENPAGALKLPPKSAPKVPYLALAAQQTLFGTPSEAITQRDRVMIGCGMGTGLRVNELLALEPGDVRLDGADPHLLVQYGGAGRAPTKSRRARRVELFEPGLGFWRIWMATFYAAGTELVFEGPRGGYQKSWPEGFPGWAAALGLPALSSHIMRHTYAVALLSGTWGYEPRSLDFVSQQLGHGDRQTTERYYGAFEAGVWRREVQRMTGQAPADSRGPVTAAELLMGSRDAAADSAPPVSLVGTGSGIVPRHSPHLVAQPNKADSEQNAEASPQSLARAVLEAASAADPRVVALAIRLAEAVLLAEPACAEPEASAG